MTSKEKFDEVVEFLKEEYESNSLIVNKIIEMVMDDIFKDYPTDYLGTFAEFKSIDRSNAPPSQTRQSVGQAVDGQLVIYKKQLGELRRKRLMRINDDKVLVAEIRDALNKNKELFGERFCPCVPSYKYCTQNAKDYICPCKDFRENVKEGDTCHCGLFIK